MVDYKDILTNILNLSDFYHREKRGKSQYLLLEPIIINKIGIDPNITKNELKEYLDIFFINDNNITEKIIDFYVSTKKILYDKNNSSYILNFNNADINEKHRMYNNMYNLNLQEINDICHFFMSNIRDDIYFDISENIYRFLLETINNNIDINNINNIYKNIANLLNKLYDSMNKYISVIKNIIKGIIILKSIENWKYSNFISTKKPKIYVDNMFITNLFAWCDYPFHNSTLLTLETLKEFNFEICVHNITVDLILEYVELAQKQKNNIHNNNLQYYIINTDYNNKNALLVKNKELINIKEDIINKINEHSINIIDNFFWKNKEENIELFNKIHEDREKINIERGIQNDIAEKQTLYDFTVILLYKDINVKKGNTLSSMENIFLTYQKAIIKNRYNKKYNLYSKIMNTNVFMNVLLLEAIISNIQNIDKLINIALINSYSSILNQEIINYINNVHNEITITEEERKTLLYLPIDKEDRNLIIENDNDPIKILEIIKEREKNRDNEIQNKIKEIEYKNKEILDKNKEILDKNKEILDKNKEILDKNKEILDKDKEIRKIEEEKKLWKLKAELLEEHSKIKEIITKKKICKKIKNILLILVPVVICLILLIIFKSYIFNIVSIILENKYIEKIIYYFSYNDYKDIIKNIIGSIIIIIITSIVGFLSFIVKSIYNKIIKKHKINNYKTK